MVIENKLESAKARLGYIVLIFVSLILLIWAFLKDIPNQNYATLYLAIALIGGYIYLRFINVHYFYLNDSGKKIVVRYFNVHPMLQKYKMFEIPKNNIVGYEIKNNFFGLKKYLVIKVKSKQGQTVYPEVNISGLNKKNEKLLLTALDKISK